MARRCGRDLLEVRRRIVVARGVELVEHVVRVVGGDARLQLILVPLVRGVARRPRLVPAERAAGHHHQEVDRADHARRAAAPCSRRSSTPDRCVMLSMIILRMMRLRPAICVGALASGTRPSTKSGYVSPQTQQCIAPIEVPEHQPQVVHLQPVDQHGVLRAHHVVVGVFRKPRVQAVARLARFAVADAVGQDDEVARGVEQLAGAEQLAAEGLRQERRSRCRRCREGSAPRCERSPTRRASACRSSDSAG